MNMSTESGRLLRKSEESQGRTEDALTVIDPEYYRLLVSPNWWTNANPAF